MNKGTWVLLHTCGSHRDTLWSWFSLHMGPSGGIKVIRLALPCSCLLSQLACRHSIFYAWNSFPPPPLGLWWCSSLPHNHLLRTSCPKGKLTQGNFWALLLLHDSIAIPIGEASFPPQPLSPPCPHTCQPSAGQKLSKASIHLWYIKRNCLGTLDPYK